MTELPSPGFKGRGSGILCRSCCLLGTRHSFLRHVSHSRLRPPPPSPISVRLWLDSGSGDRVKKKGGQSEEEGWPLLPLSTDPERARSVSWSSGLISQMSKLWPREGEGRPGVPYETEAKLVWT